MNTEKILEVYEATGSIRETSRELKISESKVRKTLIALGAYESETSLKIKELKESGMSDDEIMNKLKISKTCLNANTAYGKGMYKADKPTINALRIREHRKKLK